MNDRKSLPMSISTMALNTALELLDAHPDYRVLKRIPQRSAYAEPDGRALCKGIVLDTETTGRVSGRDKIIELGMVAFEYDPETGQVYRLLDSFNQLEDPGFPIPPEATAVNGIDDGMVRGHRIDDEAVAAFVAEAQIIIAHNARFDRGFCEIRFPVFETLPWSCSFEEVPWDQEGLGSAKLEFIATKFGLFYEAHRAEADCRALLEVLQHPLPNSGVPALKGMADFASRPTCRINALNSAFETKDLLKARGYRWDSEKRCWHTTTLNRAAMDEEVAWLKEAVYAGRKASLEFEISDATNRYSGRPGKIQTRHI